MAHFKNRSKPAGKLHLGSSNRGRREPLTNQPFRGGYRPREMHR